MEKINNGSTAMRVEKILSAPIDLVWQAWINSEQIAAWWGPAGFTTTIHKMELTNGGEWRLTMHGPDGKDYLNKSVFLEIVLHKKIVFQHYNPNYIATIIFEPKGNTTFVQWTSVFETPELYETVVKVFKADEGLKQIVEKLENYLTQKPN